MIRSINGFYPDSHHALAHGSKPVYSEFIGKSTIYALIFAQFPQDWYDLVLIRWGQASQLLLACLVFTTWDFVIFDLFVAQGLPTCRFLRILRGCLSFQYFPLIYYLPTCWLWVISIYWLEARTLSNINPLTVYACFLDRMP